MVAEQGDNPKRKVRWHQFNLPVLLTSALLSLNSLLWCPELRESYSGWILLVSGGIAISLLLFLFLRPIVSSPERETSGGLQYGVRELLLLSFAVAYIVGLSKWLWKTSNSDTSPFSDLLLYLLMFFTGGIFFAIARYMRNRTPNRKLSRPTGSVTLVILFSTIVVLFYHLWGMTHLDHDILLLNHRDLNTGFPHGWPYPDKAYLYLYGWLESRRSSSAHKDLQDIVQLVFLPILAVLFWCVGILLPTRKRQ
jgi:hypothetical protein